MKSKLNFRTAVWVCFAAIAVLGLAAGAGAIQGDKKIRMYDDCDPATFNARFGDGTCVGGGHTTLDEFLGEIEATQSAHKWRNQPNQVQLNAGHSLVIENQGGETHTFTPVAAFGGGFFTELNGISGNPVPAPECLNIGALLFIPSGGVEEGPVAGSSELPAGTHRFQCCIHPWMRTIIQVAGSDVLPATGKTMEHHHH